MRYGLMALAHKTKVHRLAIRYRFHPLAGKEFPCIRIANGPPATCLLQLPERRLTVPLWMTEESGAELSEDPRISLDCLCALSTMVEHFLRELRPDGQDDPGHEDPSDSLPARATAAAAARSARSSVGGSRSQPGRAAASGARSRTSRTGNPAREGVQS